MTPCNSADIGSPSNAYECIIKDYPAGDCPHSLDKTILYYGFMTKPNPYYMCTAYPSQQGSCPINENSISCADGFVYNKTESNLGADDQPYCWFTCELQPNPYDSNKAWPCTKPGYIRWASTGEGVCCVPN